MTSCNNGGLNMASSRRKSVFTKLLTTYIVAIIAATLGIGTLSYTISTRIYNRQIKEENTVLINQYKAFIKTKLLDNIERININFILSEETARGLKNFFSDATPDFSEVQELSTVMRQNVINHKDIISDIFVTNLKTNTTLSASDGLKLLDTHTEQDAIIHQPMYRQKLSMGWNYLYNDKNAVSSICFVQKYPVSSSKTTLGYIAVSTNISIVSSLINGLNRYQKGTLILAGKENAPVCTSGSANSTLKSSLKDLDPKGQGSGHLLKHKGDNYYLTYSDTFSNGWRLVKYTPVKEFYASSFRLQKLLFCVMVLAITLGIAFSSLLAYRMYLPLKKITQKIVKHPVTPLQNTNEYEFIDDTILNLSSKVSELNLMLQQNRPLLESNIISGLLNRTISDQVTLDQRLSLINLKSHSNCCLVVCIRLTNYLPGILDEKNLQLYKLNLIHKIDTAYIGSCLSGEYHRNEIVTILFSDNKIQPDNFVEALSLTNINPLESFHIGIGSTHKDPMHLSQSYEDARTALEYSYFSPEHLITDYDSVKDYMTPQTDMVGDLIVQFNKKLRARNTEAVPLVDQIISLLKGQKLSHLYLKAKLLDLMHTYATYSKEMGLDIKSEIDNFITRFNEAENIDDFQILFKVMVHSALNIQADRAANATDHTIHTLCDYIDNNLSEDLSLGKLSGMIGFSSGHLSRLFKEITGQNLPDYITERRMEKACMLLKNTSQNIEVISKKVGYMTPHYFSKKFKETYGYTPKHYRMEMLSKAGNLSD